MTDAKQDTNADALDLISELFHTALFVETSAGEFETTNIGLRAAEMLRATLTGTVQPVAVARNLADEVCTKIEALLSEGRQDALLGLHQVRAIKEIETRIRSALAPATLAVPEATVSVIARTVRKTLKDYGHKTADSSLPEVIASDVAAALSGQSSLRAGRGKK